MLTPVTSNIPQELKALPRWITWRAETWAPGEKPRKVPYDPRALNSRASSTDPTTWATFEQAETAYSEREGDTDAFTGVGLVLNGDGLAGIDIDDCVTDGTPDPAALALLDSLNAAYVEISPSGTGLRGFGYAPPLDKGAKGKDGSLNVEVYSTARYLTLTGHTLKAGPLAPLKGFKELAERIRGSGNVDPKTGKPLPEQPDARHAELVRRVLSGDVFHDSLRDLAASMVVCGMKPGAVVNHLRGLMDASAAPHDARWQARRGQIPDLVNSAARKCAQPAEFGTVIDADTGEVHAEHPLAQFVDIGEEPRPPRWVIPGFIGHGVVTIAGAHGVGKTTAMLPLAMVAAGLHSIFDPLAPRHWRHVVYIVEDVEQARRILAGIVGWGDLPFSLAEVRERLHIVEARRLDPRVVAQVGTTYREQFTRNVEGVEVLPLVVVDTKAAVLELDNENDNSEASRAMAALKQGFDGLPTWLIGHVAKTNIGRSDVAGLSLRGGSAFEADANQVLFLVKEADETRWLVRGKTRFEAKWAELQISAATVETQAADEFGNVEAVTLRWGIPQPPAANRKELKEQAKESAQQTELAELRDDIRNAVQEAWNLGHPLNKAGVRGKVKKQGKAVADTIESLLAEGWLYEVAVPSKVRTHPRRSSFMVNLNTEQHEAFIADGVIPEELVAIPQSWRKPDPGPEPEPEQEAGQPGFSIVPDENSFAIECEAT